MKTVRGLLGLAVGLSACSAATLPFKPETPSPGSAISADYIILADRVRVEVDTGGYRLEDAQLVRTDGAGVRPQAIESPPPGTGSSVGLGIGMGGTSYGRGSAVGVGTGVGMEVPVGPATGSRATPCSTSDWTRPGRRRGGSTSRPPTRTRSRSCCRRAEWVVRRSSHPPKSFIDRGPGSKELTKRNLSTMHKKARISFG